MIRGNTSDFIGHRLPKDFISDLHMGPPATPGPRVPHHLNPALFMLLRALHVEIEMKNLNLQVTLLVQKAVGTSFPRVHTPLHPCW